MSTSAYQLSFVFGDEDTVMSPLGYHTVMSYLTKVGLTDVMC